MHTKCSLSPESPRQIRHVNALALWVRIHSHKPTQNIKNANKFAPTTLLCSCSCLALVLLPSPACGRGAGGEGVRNMPAVKTVRNLDCIAIDAAGMFAESLSPSLSPARGREVQNSELLDV